MKLEDKSRINRPLDEVYTLVRDELSKLVPYLLNVDKIETIERSEVAGKVKLVNHWYAKAEIPSVAKKFVKPDLLAWKDLAEWDNSTHSVTYSLESFLGNDLFDANGTNTFVAIDEKTTELTVSCEVKIYPDKVPGVPRFLAKKVAPHIESFIEKLLGPNLTSLGEGLNRYFEQN
ncbi:MAG: hypothetical protein HN509_18795 [Halobacteriovoraceae bacterium]|nr:hypothetical protein [Halobacteriovoraceae bacterium]MBT5095732.1 hypothetical protein [Halobacteriovoraceae bacterium]